MNCPRCGERMYGSVCPRCGNIVVSGSSSQRKSTPVRRNTVSDRNSGVKFMDGGSKTVRPSAKKPVPNNVIYKVAVVALAVLCVFFFFRYRSVSANLQEAQNTINTQNESIKSKDQEIAQLKADAAKSADGTADGESEDSTAPSVEFDENGNLVNITDNGGSDGSDSSDGSESEKTTYKSGDTYTVKDGDSGSVICKAIYGEYSEELWEKLLSANGMTTSSNFHPGDELKIP